MASDDWCLAWAAGCDVDWTAWAAIFTAAAVAVALFGPAIYRMKRTSRANLIVATLAYESLIVAHLRIKALHETYWAPNPQGHAPLPHGLLFIEASEEREALASHADAFDLEYLIKTLSEWPDTSADLAGPIASAVTGLRPVRMGCTAPLRIGPNHADLPGFLGDYGNRVEKAGTKLLAAIDACNTYRVDKTAPF